MNNLWIIGNGFDVNYGLDTDYRHFLERAYLLNEDVREERERLIGYAGDPWDSANRWCDLELLLGDVSGAYKPEETELFHDTFEHMEDLILDYLGSEQKRITEQSITKECLSEFASSVTGFHERLREADKSRFYGHQPCDENCTHKFISLNYTDLLDRLIDTAIANGDKIGSHLGGNGSRYADYSGGLLHPHGAIAENGEIVFGVSDESQLTARVADNEDFLNLWVKQRRNLNEYKNLRTRDAFECIQGADSICLFGVALGKTDSYLWEQVGKRLKNNCVCLVFYAYEYVEGVARRDNQKRRHAVERRLMQALGWTDEQLAEMQNRVFIEPSDKVFKTKLAFEYQGE